MKSEKVKAEFVNLETHVGPLKDSKLTFKRCSVTYEDLMLTIEDGENRARLHARNINNVHLEKKSIRIAAINFEITEPKREPSVVSGAIRLEFSDQKEADTWFKEIWG